MHTSNNIKKSLIKWKEVFEEVDLWEDLLKRKKNEKGQKYKYYKNYS